MISIATTGVLLGLAAAPLPWKEDLATIQISLQLDRTEYVDREPVFAEWSIRNISKQPVEIAFAGPHLAIKFECAGDDGVVFPVQSPWIVNIWAKKGNLILPSAEARNWIDLRNYQGLLGPGKYRIRAVYDTGGFNIPKGSFRGIVTSNWVPFTILPADEPDARVSTFLAQRTLKESPRIFDPPLEPITDPRRLKIRESSFYYQMGYFSNSEVNDFILQSGSERFRAPALFYRGEKHFKRTETENFEAVLAYRECFASEAASPYLRGLAAERWMNAKRLEATPNSMNEAKLLALWILREMPRTYMADQAQKFLNQLKQPNREVPER